MSTPRNKSKLSVLLYDSSDLDLLSHNRQDRPTPPIRKTSVSRLSFPFVKSAPKQSQSVQSTGSVAPVSPSVTTPPVSAPAPTPYTHALTSTLPFVCRPHHDPQRHNYGHRGYSRHALTHIKWFWAFREEDWESRMGPIRSYKPRLDESFIETAMDDPFVLGRSGNKQKTPVYPTHSQQPELHALTVHPRRGDLTSLRDPYCTEIDRTFASFPMWTIGKTLWMYDVHLASQDRPHTDSESVDGLDIYDDTESECDSHGTPGSVTDDSDTTLVDSETESDMSAPESPNPDDDIHPSFHKSSWSHLAYSEPPPPHTSVSSSGKLSNSRPLWTMYPHRCWDCMIEVFHRP
jgi:hypothetical protein